MTLELACHFNWPVMNLSSFAAQFVNHLVTAEGSSGVFFCTSLLPMLEIQQNTKNNAHRSTLHGFKIMYSIFFMAYRYLRFSIKCFPAKIRGR